MKYGFVIGTPLHLINAINICENLLNKGHFTFFIQNNFINSKELITSIEKFSSKYEVIEVEMSIFKNNFKRQLNKYLHLNPLYSDILDHIFIPSDMKYVRQLFGSQKKNNPNIKLSYYEDGLAAYFNEVFIKETRNEKKYNKYTIENQDISNYYVYEPSLAIVGEKDKYIKIPKLTNNNPAFGSIKTIFKASFEVKFVNKSNEKEVVFFDQTFKSDGSNLSEFEVFRVLEDICIRNNIPIKVKLHPRSKADKYGDRIEILDTKLPWEVFLLFSEIESFILVGISTTALFSPILMFGEDISAILLSKIILNDKQKSLDKQTLSTLNISIDFLGKLQNRSEESLRLPSSNQELVSMLKEVN